MHQPGPPPGRGRRLLAAALSALLVVGGAVLTSAAPAAAADCYSYDVQYTDGTSDVGALCDGTKDATPANQPGLLANSLHLSCSDNLSYPEKSDLAGRTADTWSITKPDGKTCSGTLADLPSGCVAYDVAYTSGAVDAGTWCDGNDIDRAGEPDLAAVKLHVSCSDDLLYPEKSDLGGLTVETWSIEKADGKTCGGELGDPPADCTVYEILYTDGQVDDGFLCDGNDATRATDPDLLAVSVHVSCSDNLTYPEKSDFGGLVVQEWTISEGGVVKCGGDETTPPKDCIHYDVRYTDGERDTGIWCGGNDMRRADVPDLLALEIHVSCSDDLRQPEKSDFDGRIVEAWKLTQDDGKHCGDAELPPHEPGDPTDPGDPGDGGDPADPPADPAIAIDFGCLDAQLTASAPIGPGEVTYDDGSVVPFDFGDATAVELPTGHGRWFVSIAVDGVTYEAPDMSYCDSSQTYEDGTRTVVVDCEQVTVTDSAGIGSGWDGVALLYTDGTYETHDGHGATELVVDINMTKELDGVYVADAFYDATVGANCYCVEAADYGTPGAW